MKAAVALTLLVFTVPIVLSLSGGLSSWKPPTEIATWVLFFSGVIGLGVGDLFLLDAFVRIGVSRTLMLYGFQPLMLGFGAALMFDQSFDLHRLIAVAFLIACLLIFSLEKYRETRSWEVSGLVMAIIGVSMDSAGVLLTRFAFERSPHTHPLEGHFIRCAGALASYAVIAFVIHTRRRFRRARNEEVQDTAPVIGLVSNFLRLDLKSRALLLLGCFGGTYLSLCLYLTAIQIGHLASLAAITITGPMFAALLETLILKKLPSGYLLTAFAFFVLGFYVLLR